MVQLVLEQPGGQLVGLDLDLVAVEVQTGASAPPSAAPSRRRGRGSTGSPRRTPTRRRLDDRGVEDDRRVVADVVHEDLLLHADLRCGEAEASLRYIVLNISSTRRTSLPSMSATSARLGLQHGVAEGADRYGHAARLPMPCRTTSTSRRPTPVGRGDRRPSRARVPRSRCAPTGACSATAALDTGTESLLAAEPGPARRGRCSTSAAAPGAIALRSPCRRRRPRCGPSTSTSEPARSARQRRRDRLRPTCASPPPTTSPTIFASPPLVQPADPHRQAGAPRAAHAWLGRLTPDGDGHARRAQAPRRRLAATLARRRGLRRRPPDLRQGLPPPRVPPVRRRCVLRIP